MHCWVICRIIFGKKIFNNVICMYIISRISIAGQLIIFILNLSAKTTIELKYISLFESETMTLTDFQTGNVVSSADCMLIHTNWGLGFYAGKHLVARLPHMQVCEKKTDHIIGMKSSAYLTFGFMVQTHFYIIWTFSYRWRKTRREPCRSRKICLDWPL